MVAILAGVAGFFAIPRGMSFAAYSPGQVGSAGAAGAVFLGVAPLWRLVIFAVDGAHRSRHRIEPAARPMRSAAHRSRSRPWSWPDMAISASHRPS